MDPLDDFTRFDFWHDGYTKRVYRKGDGPPVIVIHEMPGITPEVARFGRRVADNGFTVFMPSLFGTDGKKPRSKLDYLPSFAQVCISRQFALFTENRSGPVVDWLRALARMVHAEIGGRGVGVVGMCLTGNFALTMAVDPEVMAPVLAQPSLPLCELPLCGKLGPAVNASPETLKAVRERHEADGIKVIGLRFDGDTKCPPERFKTLDRELGPAFEPHELKDSSARTGKANPHSVLTTELIDEEGELTRAALDRVLGYFEERLKG
ncbi:MAG TPA: dienelactone hydrolase family protein [Allosphingosinicella sp.]|jgi:dienelactone hydrolase